MVQKVKSQAGRGLHNACRSLSTRRWGSDVPATSSDAENPTGNLGLRLDVALDQSEKNPVYKSQYAMPGVQASLRKGASRTAWSRRPEPSGEALDHPGAGAHQELAGFPEVVPGGHRPGRPIWCAISWNRPPEPELLVNHAGNPPGIRSWRC